MSPIQLLLSIAGGLIALGLLELWLRWKLSRSLLKLAGRTKEPSSGPGVLDPEHRHLVRFTDSAVIHELPDGTIERVDWGDLEKMEVVTTGDGPFVADVFWVLHGGQSSCVVPQRATGHKALLHRLQELPGFSNEAFVEAMSSTSDNRFLCWEKPANAAN